jgi:hypothetical protein
MKLNIVAFVLFASITAFAQAHGGGRPAGVPAGGNSGAAMGHSSMGSMGATSNRPDVQQPQAHSSSSMSKQSPDLILSRDTKLSSNLQKLLPQGTTAQQACSGFKNLGGCVAAIHVSHNLGIPFEDLKAKTIGDNAQNLGKAIQTLKPDVDSKAEVNKAKKQAETDLSEPNS